jgi:steroid Delta-isomerase
MPGPAVDIISRFGSVEDDQRYTRLVELFFGPQVGKAAIATFMGHMEQMVPNSGARFETWHSEGDEAVGWATWTMVARGETGDDVPVPGQSLYRLRHGKVCFAADYVDSRAYRKLRPSSPKRPDLNSAAGLAAPYRPSTGTFPAEDLIRRFWAIQDAGDYTKLSPLFADDAVFADLIYGRMEGGPAIAAYMEQMKSEMPAQGVTFELVDCAGDTSVGWSQWNCHFAGKGTIPGWTLHTMRGDQITLDADYFDVQASRDLRS